jgi:hypothetical protein
VATAASTPTVVAAPPPTPSTPGIRGAAASARAWFHDQSSGNYAAAVALETADEQEKNDTSTYSIETAQPKYFQVAIRPAVANGAGAAAVPVSFDTEDNADGVCRHFGGQVVLQWQNGLWRLGLTLTGGPVSADDCS